MHQPKPDKSREPTAGDDPTEHHSSSRFIVYVEREGIVSFGKLNDFFPRHIIRPEIKHVARLIVLGETDNFLGYYGLLS